MQKYLTMAGSHYHYDSQSDTERPTSEDEDNFLEWLQVQGRVKLWLKASLLVAQIYDAFLEYGKPSLSELNNRCVFNVQTLSRSSLEILVRIFENTRAEADPVINRLLAKVLDPPRIEKKNKQRSEMVQYVIRRREAVTKARHVEGFNLDIESAEPEEMGQRSPRIIQHGFERVVVDPESEEIAIPGKTTTKVRRMADMRAKIYANAASGNHTATRERIEDRTKRLNPLRSDTVPYLPVSSSTALGTQNNLVGIDWPLFDERETPGIDETSEDCIERTTQIRTDEVLEVIPTTISKKK
jgi:hypothetical protein